MMLNNLFHTPIFIKDYDIKDINKEICDTTYNLMKKDLDSPLMYEGRNDKKKDGSIDYDKYGYTSFFNTNLLLDVGLLESIHQITIKAVEEYLLSLNMLQRFHFNNSWVGLYKRGNRINEHIHPNSHISMVYYAKATKGTGEIWFKNPALPMFAMSVDDHCELSKNSIKIDAIEGRLILFPSYVPHLSEPHLSDDDRIVFSSNLVFTNSSLSKI
jgi:uncharacterized protein (TIGR02466 family)